MIVYILMALTAFISTLSLMDRKKQYYYRVFLSILLVLLYFLLVDFTSFSNDISNYFESLTFIKNKSLFESLKALRYEYGFSIYLWFLSKFVNEISIFLVINVLVISSILTIALRKHYKQINFVILIFSLLSLFYFVNFTTNIIRQGIAFSIIVFSSTQLYEKKYLKSILSILVASLFHISSLVFLPLILIMKYSISLKTLLAIYFLAAVLMISNTNSLIATYFPSNLGLLSDLFFKYSSTGFVDLYGKINRLDFLVFTSAWIVFSLVMKKIFVMDNYFDWVIKIYLNVSIIFAMFSFISFSDRIAGYGWGLIPLLLVYPLSSKHLKNKFAYSMIIIAISIALALFFDVLKFY